MSVTDEMIEVEFKNTNFGDQKPKDVLIGTLLRYAVGYDTGFTAMTIAQNLGLITRRKMTYRQDLTKKGKAWLRENINFRAMSDTAKEQRRNDDSET